VRFHYRLIVVVNLIAVLALFSACGQSSHRDSASSKLPTRPAGINLGAELLELDAMQAPEGANPAIFEQLKASLREALIARGVDKLTSTPPTGAANAVPDFAVTDTGGATADLTWHYYNLGDYNQDGVVGIADITPLAMHFGEGWSVGQENTLPAVVDGSGDGTVNIADVTQIAMNFGVEAASYVIEWSNTEGGTYADVQSVPIADGLDKDSNRMRFATNISYDPSLWYRVAPADSSLAHGIPSNAVQLIVPGTPVASIVPDIASGLVPLTVNFDASGSADLDGTIVLYEWDLDGDGTFDFDTGTTPNTNVTYTVAGNYNPAVRVTDNDSLQDTASVLIQVSATPQAPVASIVPSINHGPAPLDVTLDGSGSTDADGSIVKYEWDLTGDGIFELDTGTTSSVNYTYTSDGFYHPAVRVTDNDAMQGTASANVTVSFPSWAHTWGVAGADWSTGMDFGTTGNIYMSGASDSFKGGFFISTMLTMYTPAGDPAWVKTWGGTMDDWSHDVAVDTSDNVYVVGETFSFGAGGTDAFILKYDSAGTLLWQETIGGALDDKAVAVDVDAAGNIFLACSTLSWNLLGDMLIMKLDSTGAILWQRTWSYFATEYPTNLVVDGGGNVYVVGQADSFGSGDNDAILIKYDTLGTLLWEKRWAGAGVDIATDVGFDASGNVYVTGQTDSFGAGDFDVFLLKYLSDGTFVWQQAWGTSARETPSRIAVDAGSGTIYISGDTTVSPGVFNAFLLHYSSSGTLEHQMVWTGPDYIDSKGLLYDSSGALYLSGAASNSSGSWTSIAGTVNVGLGTPSDPPNTSDVTVFIPGIPSGTVADQVGTIDTGGGSSDQLIVKENTLFW
jgi:hypothetical protein